MLSATLVLLHGHAGHPRTFTGLAPALALVAPVARPLAQGLPTWWSDDSDGPSDDDVDHVVLPDGPVVLGGFSQGAAMALAVAARRPEVVGLVLVAGFLVEPPADWQHSKRPLTLCMHSDDDEIVDPFLGARLARWIHQSGCEVSENHYDGGHQWTSEVDRRVIEWVNEHWSVPLERGQPT